MLEVTSVYKEYLTPRGPVPILADVSLRLVRGDAVAIVGPSGSGKSTLLYLLGTLEPPTRGRITLDGTDPFALNERRLAAFRNRQVGFVFEDHGLLPQCSVLENVLTPTLVGPRDPAGDGAEVRRARSLIAEVGLGDRLDHRPGELSGGERQRAALARALIGEPALLLCDEPTGNLDRMTAESVVSLLLSLPAVRQTMLVLATHSMPLAEKFPVRYEIDDGTLAGRSPES